MLHRPPPLTHASRLLTRTAGVTDQWRPLTCWATALALLAATLTLDLFTGAQVNVLFLYLAAAGFAAWSLGERNGLLFAVLTGIGAAAVRHLQYAGQSDHPVMAATEAWNGFARLLSIGLVVTLVSGMRTALQLERWRASTDGLTGVLNKASFHDRMAAATAAGRDADRAFILCYMDLDGFKQVNDRHGHSAGDDILRIFASGVVEAIREDDLFARIGGDEFVALLTIPSVDQGDAIAIQVHRRISAVLTRTGLDVSCSMGALVATASQIEPLEAAIQRADALMYEVKHTGKNALRIGRIDPARALTAPDGLEIRSGMASSLLRGQKRAAAADRRTA